MMKKEGFALFAVAGSERFLSLEQVLRGDFVGHLQYHEVPQVETLLNPARFGPVLEGDVPPVEARVRGSGVASGKVVSRRQSAIVDYALEEDVGGSSISRHLRRKHNIDPLFSKSHVVIEIADTDDPQAVEAADLRRPGELGVVGTYSASPSIPGDAPSATSPSSLGATGVYLPR
ncbi:unnamed protein product [Lactuca virosa]|uniref:Uncharacterized protein n=1 Tax=Lactuca virosa TaxID=75947 RepID=A0AAU9P0Q9_9ASTR|nr:unnamed protein product [Lactuca virosa]